MVIITTSSDRDRCNRLERSAKYHGHHLHIFTHPWTGYLDKLHVAATNLRHLASEGHTHFLYTDAWDTLFTRYIEPLTGDGLIFSAERACYPHSEKEPLYPSHPSPWHFVNGGGWGGSIATFLRLYDTHPPSSELNDQVWLTDRYLHQRDTFGITLDCNCDTFQTLAFCPESDFDPTTFTNTVTGSTPALWHGNGHTPIPPFIDTPEAFDTLNHASANWANHPDQHRKVAESMHYATNDQPKLKALRDHIEANALGFGERCFYEMWRQIITTLPPKSTLLEIGVYKGQTLALWRTLAPKATIIGITPLDTSGGFTPSDYAKDIADLHAKFKLKQPTLMVGTSTAMHPTAPLCDVVYIDGDHSYEGAKSDVYLYSSNVKVGGYLVIDDCANRYHLPDGYFAGIESVSKAVDELLPNDHYCEVLSVGHNRIFKRVK